MDKSGGKCDCCSRDSPEIHVRSSAIGPASFGYCIVCLTKMAEPEWGFHYLYDFVSSDGEGLNEGITSLQTYKNGEYITWEQWKQWRQTEPQKSELDKKRNQQFEEINNG